MRTSDPAENAGEMLLENPGLPGGQEGDSIVAVDTCTQQNDEQRQFNESQTTQLAELQSQESNLDGVAEQARDSMETRDVNAADRWTLEGPSGSVAPEGPVIERTFDSLIDLGSMPFQDEGLGTISGLDGQSNCVAHSISESGFPNPSYNHIAPVPESSDVDMSIAEEERDQSDLHIPQSGINLEEPSSQQNDMVVQDAAVTNESSLNSDASNANGIDPAFLEALPEDLRAEVLASQQAQAAPPPTYAPPTVEDIDPEFLAALPPDIQAEVLAQQRAQRIMQQSEGQPVDMDNASIIATFPAELREEVCMLKSLCIHDRMQYTYTVLYIRCS